MNIGIIGSGGREHALCLKLKESEIVNKIYCFPGNGGTSSLADNIRINPSDFEKLKELILKLKIELVVVGPEKPLVDGVANFLKKNKIKVFGPSKIASQLEGSKIFTKNLCKKYKIPTANFGVFNSIEKSIIFLNKCRFPLVVKADGLAAGKGVYICETYQESKNAIEEIFNGKFGDAKEILIEEFLKGEEMSFFIISDGVSYKKFGTAQDHKRVLEGDQGKNTGGMGAYSPSRLENKELEKKILNKIIEPTLQGLKDLKTNFNGFLYAGLMIVENEPFLIEYNVRMGDPECQTILPKLESDFGEIIEACVNEKLHLINLDWSNDKSLCIVLCSKGYPEKYYDNIEIKNLKNLPLNKDEFIFHAGTQEKNSKIYSNGGRVLNFVSIGSNLKSARDETLNLIKKLNWRYGHYRRDIAFKVIKN